MNQLLQTKLDAIYAACKERNVEKLYSFGSINRDNFSSESDIDLLVEFGEMNIENYADNYFDFCDDLEVILSRKVDLVTTKSVKNPYFKKEVEKTRKLIYDASA